MKKIVIIGGGYGGLRALEHLHTHEQFEITLIDKNAYHYMQTETYGYIAGRFDISDIALDIETFVKGLQGNIRFVQDRAFEIDREKKEVRCSTQNIPYDYLIIAVGAQTNFFSFIEGAREFTHGIKNIQRAFEFRQTFESKLYHKLQHDCHACEEHFHIAIAGAGLSGVEVAAEMGYVLRRYRKIFAPKSAKITISLIDAADTILPGMDAYLVEKTRQRLEALDVHIYEKTFISKITPQSILFQDGKEMPFDFVIFTAGIKAARLIDTIDTEKNRQGQVIPDEMLRIKGSNDIFIIGDCAHITDKDGAMLPPTAQIAEKSAAYVAQAIIASQQHTQIVPFDAKVDGVFIALGGKYAVGTLFGKIRLSGYGAYLMKKLITRMYRFGLELKVNTGYKQRNKA